MLYTSVCGVCVCSVIILTVLTNVFLHPSSCSPDVSGCVALSGLKSVCLSVCVCVCSLSSLSTSEFRSPSHGGNLNRSASLSCTERAPDSGSVGGSINQIPGTPFQYIPDFCVRALADLQFVKVTVNVLLRSEVLYHIKSMQRNTQFRV